LRRGHCVRQSGRHLEESFGAVRRRGAEPLEGLPLRHVRNERDDANDLAVAAQLGNVRRLYEPRLALLERNLSLVSGLLARQGAGDVGAQPLVSAVADDILDGTTDELWLRTAEPLLVGSADEAVADVRVDVRNAERQSVRDQLQLLLTVAEGLLGFAALGDVAGEATRVNEPSV